MPSNPTPRLTQTTLLLLPALLLAMILGWLAGLEESPAPAAAKTAAAPSGTAAMPAPAAPTPGGSAVTAAEDVFARFDAWAVAFTGGETAEGVALARERRAALRELIMTNPEAALGRALPWTLRRRMPPEVAALLEERVSATGEFSVMAGMPAPGSGGPAVVMRDAVVEGRVYRAHVFGRRQFIGTKRELPIEGIAVDEELALLDRPVRTLEAEEPLAGRVPEPVARDGHKVAAGSPEPVVSGGRVYQNCCAPHADAFERELAGLEDTPGPSMGGPDLGSPWTEGQKRLLVIRVDFSDVPGTPSNRNDGLVITPDVATGLINGATNTYMRETSYDKHSLLLATADVTPVLRLPQTAAYYAAGDRATQLRNDALAAASANGYNISQYDRQLAVFSWLGTSTISGSRFTWAGLGNVGGPFTWYNGFFDARVVPHELGHNLGLWHANLWVPASGNPVDLNGAVQEYGDPFDCMGGGSISLNPRMHFNPWFLSRIDWLPPASIQTVTEPGIYRVHRFDHMSALNTGGRTLALRVRKDDTRNYWIGYRRKFAGLNNSLADVAAGAYIVWGFNVNQGSQLIDVDTPGSNPSDASLNVGQMLVDGVTGQIFRVLGAGGTGVDEYLDIEVDQLGRVTPAQAAYDVDETAGSVTISLYRAGKAISSASVTVMTADGTAVAGSDYHPVSTTLEWNSVDVSPKSVTIPIISDGIREPSEHFFVHFQPAPGSPATTQVAGSPIIVHIREPGMADSSFSHASLPAEGGVRRVMAQLDGNVLFTGNAASVGTQTVNGLGRFLPDGQLDPSFEHGTGVTPRPGRALARQADGRVLVGGDFTQIQGLPRARVARLLTDGSVDTGFDPGSGANGPVHALAVQTDGKILVGGAFTEFGGQPRRGLARLLPDGALDTAFPTVPPPLVSVMEVEALALQQDGKILAAGLIHTSGADQLFTGGLSSGVLRLMPDGTVDGAFDPGAGAHLDGAPLSPARVRALALQMDGRVLVGGEFTAFNNAAAPRLARLLPDGSLDAAFQTALGAAGANGTVRDILAQPNGRILVAGEFTNLGIHAARLLPDGAWDESFDTALPATGPGGEPAYCHDLELQADGRLLLATNARGTGAVRRVFTGLPGRAGRIEFFSGSHKAIEGGGVFVEVRRVNGSLGKVSVNYATLPGTADETDYTPVSGTLTWEHGETASKHIQIQAVQDDELEPLETFSLQLGQVMGGAFLGETAVTTITIQDPGLEGFATVRFAVDSSSVSEDSAQPARIRVQLSKPLPSTLSVPFFIAGGTATPLAGVLGDFSVTTPSPLVFQAGEVEKLLLVQPKQDNLMEGDETAVIQLGYPVGPALLEEPSSHILVILDDDLPPLISLAPKHSIVAEGQGAGPFEGLASGSLPLTVEWLRNGGRLAGVSGPQFYLPHARVADAGAYSLRVRNRVSSATSAASELVVVDASPKVIVAAKKGKAVLKVSAGGNNLGHSWRKTGASLPGGGRAKGPLTPVLNLSGLELDDAGDYVCRVTSLVAQTEGGQKFMDSGAFKLVVVDEPPQITGLEGNQMLDPAIVGGSYRFPIPVLAEETRTPMSYAASGLPKGLAVDKITGLISGKPVSAKGSPFTVTLTAANSFGKHSVKVRLPVLELPRGLAGAYSARLDRHDEINGGLGGRLDFVVAPTGALSGTLVLGGEARKFAGALEVDVESALPPHLAGLVIPRKGKPAPPPMELGFSIQDDEVRLGVLKIGDQTLSFTGWRNVWSMASNRADALAGRHNFVLEMPYSIPDVPRGRGFGTALVAASGGVTFTGMTADREKITGSALLGPDGRVVFHQALYKNKPQGSMNGEMIIEAGDLEDDPADNRVTGSLSWVRPAIAKPRLYAGGFGPVDLQVRGGFYQAPSLPLGLDGPGRVRLVFTEAGLPASREPGITLDVDARGKLIPPLKVDNRAGTTLKVTAASGLFSGKFALEDASPVQPPAVMKRSTTFQGIIVPGDDGLRGHGWFILQQLPSAIGGTTVKTSPFLSGDVLFEQVPPF